MNRRDMLKVSSYVLAGVSAPAVAESSVMPAAKDAVARWDFIELKFAGPASGNPFLDVHLAATFRLKNRVLTVEEPR